MTERSFLLCDVHWSSGGGCLHCRCGSTEVLLMLWNQRTSFKYPVLKIIVYHKVYVIHASPFVLNVELTYILYSRLCLKMHAWLSMKTVLFQGVRVLFKQWVKSTILQSRHLSAVCTFSTISRPIDLFHIINELCCSPTCQAWPVGVNNEKKLDVSGSGLSDSVALTIQYIRTNVSRF